MNHLREKAAWVIAGVLAFVAVLVLSGAIEGGPLDPPSAPGPTDGVRAPGTPISSLPFTAATSGRYYLTRGLADAGATSGVAITASNVEIDLNGFSITKASNTIAIEVAPGVTGVYIHDGNLVDGLSGIVQQPAAASTTLLIEDVTIQGATGTAMISQERTTIRRCRVADSGADGIVVGAASTIDSCVVDNAGFSGINTGSDSSVTNCRVSDSGAGDATQEAIGVGDDSVIDTCSLSDNGASGITGGAGITVRNVSVRNSNGPSAAGISLGNGAHISRCSVTSTGTGGIVTANYASIENCSVTVSAGAGITTGARSTVRNSIVDNVALDGIAAVSGSLVDGNVVTGATGDGLDLGTGNRAVNNVLTSNTAAGIHLTSTANHVEGNVANSNGTGILSDSGNSTVVRNSARDNTGANYALAADDLQGVIITLANILASGLSHFNYAP